MNRALNKSMTDNIRHRGPFMPKNNRNSKDELSKQFIKKIGFVENYIIMSCVQAVPWFEPFV